MHRNNRKIVDEILIGNKIIDKTILPTHQLQQTKIVKVERKAKLV